MTVGQDVPRIDARAKAIGETKFVGDLIIPGMVYGKLLRSPYAAARITRIDARAVDPAAPEQGRVGGVDDGIQALAGEVCADRLNPGRHGFLLGCR